MLWVSPVGGVCRGVGVRELDEMHVACRRGCVVAGTVVVKK